MTDLVETHKNLEDLTGDRAVATSSTLLSALRILYDNGRVSPDAYETWKQYIRANRTTDDGTAAPQPITATASAVAANGAFVVGGITITSFLTKGRRIDLRP